MKGIIFDFDGVIVDSERKRMHFLQEILSNKGIAADAHDLLPLIGRKTGAFLQEKFPTMGEQLRKECIQELQKAKSKRLEEYQLIPGIENLLIHLQKKGVQTAVVTGSMKSFVEKVLFIQGIYSYFSVFVTGDEVSASKPDPLCYRVGLQKMKLQPKDVIVIEDSVHGIRAAKAAGCDVYALMTYFDKKTLEKADMIFKDHKEVLQYLLKLNQKADA